MNTSIVPAEAEELARNASILAEAYVIQTKDEADMAAGDLRRIATEKKRVEEIRLSITRPMDQAKASAIAAFKPYLEKIESADKMLRGKLIAWNTEQERLAAEAAARAERERIAEEERLAAEAAAAAEAGDTERAEELAMQAEEAAFAPTAMAAPTKLAGVGTTKRFTVRSIDLIELVKAAAADPEAYLHYLEPATTEINKQVRASGARTRIPGVEIQQVAGLTVRKG